MKSYLAALLDPDGSQLYRELIRVKAADEEAAARVAHVAWAKRLLEVDVATDPADAEAILEYGTLTIYDDTIVEVK